MAQFAGLPKKVTGHLEKESARGAILIVSAYVEEILALIISESCTSEKLGEEIQQYRRPAGDFSSKILLCEAFGLISPDEASAADCLRKVRNSAAHFDSRKGRGFDVLFDSAQTVEQIKRFFELLNLELTSKKPDEIQKEFASAARLLTTKLCLRMLDVQRASVAPPLKETANAWREKMKDTEIGKLFADAEQEARDGKPENLLNVMETCLEVLKLAADPVPADQAEPNEPAEAEQDAGGKGGPRS